VRVLFLALGLAVAAAAQVPEYRVKEVHVYPHEPLAFTQGLEYHDGFLYEGTGLEGSSTLRKVELASGKPVQLMALDEQYFGEGITLTGDRVVQLTWQAHRGFVYEAATFKLLKTFEYPGEGWGLTHDAKQIYMSDGTAEIRCWDPVTLKETRRIGVHDGARPVNMLNELEFVRGEIFANVWQTDRIARISPTDGRVVGWIDLAGLLSEEERSRGADVLNGIAYDAAGDRLFVTGKLWPKLFEVQLVKK
jgi:glutamine cyclotransferase